MCGLIKKSDIRDQPFLILLILFYFSAASQERAFQWSLVAAGGITTNYTTLKVSDHIGPPSFSANSKNITRPSFLLGVKAEVNKLQYFLTVKMVTMGGHLDISDYSSVAQSDFKVFFSHSRNNPILSLGGGPFLRRKDLTLSISIGVDYLLKPGFTDKWGGYVGGPDQDTVFIDVQVTTLRKHSILPSIGLEATAPLFRRISFDLMVKYSTSFSYGLSPLYSTQHLVSKSSGESLTAIVAGRGQYWGHYLGLSFVFKK